MNFSGKRVLILGDSQAEGITPTLSAILESAGAGVSVSVHSGMSLARALSELNLGALARGQDVVVVSFGGNVPPSTEERALDQMSRFLSFFPGRTVFWLSVLPSMDPNDQPARAAMAGWQQWFLPRLGVNVINGADVTADLPRRDEVHLYASGYETLAERVAIKMGSVTTSWQRVLGVVLGVAGGVSAAIWMARRG